MSDVGSGGIEKIPNVNFAPAINDAPSEEEPLKLIENPLDDTIKP